MERSYWTNQLQGRYSRRRALALAAAGLGGGALLAACGDNDSGNGGGLKDTSGLITQPVDTTSKAKAGGMWLSSRTADFLSLDPLTSSSGSAFADYVYNRPLKFKAGSATNPPVATALEGDAVETWEIAANGLQITMKLRSNLLLDPRAPTNGRRVDTQDVKWAFDRFATSANGRGELLNSVNPSAPIESLQMLDDRTFTFKLAFPIAILEAQLATYRFLWVIPREGEDQFDPRRESRGAGPWMVEKHEPSVAYTLRRNPNTYLAGRPFLDGIEQRIVSEYAQGLSQFKAGRLWDYPVRSEDVITTKKEEPRLMLLPKPISVTERPFLLGFTQNEGSPFLDVRVRRAISMLLDRDAYIDAFYNISGFRAEGIELPSYWHSHFGAGEEPYWHDPQGKDLGEGAKYFQHNIKDATDLLRAAGHTRAIEVPFIYRPGAEPTKQGEALAGFIEQDGLFKLDRQAPVAADFNATVHTGNGRHEGIAGGVHPGPGPDIDMYLSARYNVPNNFAMFTKPIPGIQELVVRQRQELDKKKREEVLFALEKELAVQMPAVPFPGIAPTFVLAWPMLQNYEAVRALDPSNVASEVYVQYWYDESKKV